MCWLRLPPDGMCDWWLFRVVTTAQEMLALSSLTLWRNRWIRIYLCIQHKTCHCSKPAWPSGVLRLQRCKIFPSLKQQKFIALVLLFFMGVKLGRAHEGRNVVWGCLRIGCWGEYLGLRGTRWPGSGENYIMRSLMICTAHQIFFAL